MRFSKKAPPAQSSQKKSRSKFADKPLLKVADTIAGARPARTLLSQRPESDRNRNHRLRRQNNHKTNHLQLSVPTLPDNSIAEKLQQQYWPATDNPRRPARHQNNRRRTRLQPSRRNPLIFPKSPLPTSLLSQMSTLAHLDGFGSIEAIATEKSSIADGLREMTVTLIINADQPLLLDACRSKKVRKFITFGTSENADVTAHNIELLPTSSRFTIDNTTIDLPMPGPGNCQNALAAWAVCSQLSIKLPTSPLPSTNYPLSLCGQKSCKSAQLPSSTTATTPTPHL